MGFIQERRATNITYDSIKYVSYSNVFNGLPFSVEHQYGVLNPSKYRTKIRLGTYPRVLSTQVLKRTDGLSFGNYLVLSLENISCSWKAPSLNITLSLAKVRAQSELFL